MKNNTNTSRNAGTKMAMKNFFTIRMELTNIIVINDIKQMNFVYLKYPIFLIIEKITLKSKALTKESDLIATILPMKPKDERNIKKIRKIDTFKCIFCCRLICMDIGN